MTERNCPKCESKAIKKNGFTRHGKQNHRCLDCGRQFSLEPSENDFQEFLNPQIDDNIYISCKIVD
jgi:transposase-like protein